MCLIKNILFILYDVFLSFFVLKLVDIAASDLIAYAVIIIELHVNLLFIFKSF